MNIDTIFAGMSQLEITLVMFAVLLPIFLIIAFLLPSKKAPRRPMQNHQDFDHSAVGKAEAEDHRSFTGHPAFNESSRR